MCQKHQRGAQSEMDAVGPDGWIHGGAKNPHRLCEGDPSITEVLLPLTGHITIVDTEGYAEYVAPHRWYLGSQGYVRGTVKKDGKFTDIPLHIHLFPHKVAPRDHFNKNKLDNRDVNIENGANGRNGRNCVLTNGGVRPIIERGVYVAEWMDYKRKKCSKYFYWRDYDTPEEAEVAAKEYRKKKADKAVAKITAIQDAQGGGRAVIDTYVPRKRRSNTGIPNITYKALGYQARTRAGIDNYQPHNFQQKLDVVAL